MKNLSIIYFLLLSVFLIACKDDDTQSTNSSTIIKSYDNYANLKVGNYWIYERVLRDKITSTEQKTNIIDSMYVKKDTLVNGKSYYLLEGVANQLIRNVRYFKLLRDSLHYIVNQTGNIEFSSEDFSTVFNTYYIKLGDTLNRDTIAIVKSRMAEKDFITPTPAGNFTTRTFMDVYNLQDKWIRDSTKIYRKIKYAKDIGVVEEYYIPYLASPNYEVRKLLRYGTSN